MCHSNCGCGKGGCCSAHKTAKILLIVGGVNWGLVGAGMLMDSNWNVINMIVGTMPTLEGIIYVLVGLAAVMEIFGCRCKKCMTVCATCETGSMDKRM